MQTFCRTVLNHIVPFLTGDPQAPGQTGQADYTKAWEEYYKKLGINILPNVASDSHPWAQPKQQKGLEWPLRAARHAEPYVIGLN